MSSSGIVFVCIGCMYSCDIADIGSVGRGRRPGGYNKGIHPTTVQSQPCVEHLAPLGQQPRRVLCPVSGTSLAVTLTV